MAFLPSRKAAAILGLHPQTLRNYADQGKIPYYRNSAGQRLYDVDAFLGRASKPETVCYCRVSSAKQRGDLQRQCAQMRSLYPNAEIIRDIGGGLNWKRQGLLSILERIHRGDKLTLVVAHRDRLARFGFELIEGSYAVNTAFSDASRIANALGYQFISLVPRQEINAFANLAKIAGEPDDEVESFRNADLVLLVQDSLGQPRYLVVEVSYRISGDDIRRARRNAEYLERFITMTSVGAVAGVRLTDNMKREAEANHVEWHQIRPT